jgi:hypothetical protein
MTRIIFILCALVLALLWPSCTTVTPKPVASHSAFESGNNANSGIISENADGSFVVDKNFRAVFDDLIKIYGKDLVPPLKEDGFFAQPDGTFLCDKQHLEDELIMAAWKREGRLP